MTFKPNFQMTVDIVKALNEIEQSRGFIKAQRLFDAINAMPTQTPSLKNEKTIAQMISKIDPENENQLLDYRNVYSYLTEFFLQRGPISEELICEMHAVLFAGAITNPTVLGKYRSIQNHIYKIETQTILYTPIPPAKIAQAMGDLLNWLDREHVLPAVIKIGIVHLQFLTIHPFLDGNGRTIQLLTMVFLHQAGYDFKDYFVIGELYLRDRKRYNVATHASQGEGKSMTEFLEYFTKGLALQMREVQNLLELSYHDSSILR